MSAFAMALGLALLGACVRTVEHCEPVGHVTTVQHHLGGYSNMTTVTTDNGGVYVVYGLISTRVGVAVCFGEASGIPYLCPENARYCWHVAQ